MIHCRLFIGSTSSYPELYKKAYNALKPGGWLEISDVDTRLYSDDGTVKDDCACHQWSALWDDAVAKVGKPIPRPED